MFNTTIQIQKHQIEKLEKKVEDDRIHRHLDSRNITELRQEVASLRDRDSQAKVSVTVPQFPKLEPSTAATIVKIFSEMTSRYQMY